MDDKWKVLRTLKRTAGREKERLLDDWRGIVIQNKVVCTKDPFGNRWPNFTACFGSTDENGSREGYGFADVFISSCRGTHVILENISTLPYFICIYLFGNEIF